MGDRVVVFKFYCCVFVKWRIEDVEVCLFVFEVVNWDVEFIGFVIY